MTNTNVCAIASQTVQVLSSRPRAGDSADIGVFASMMNVGLGFQMSQNLPDTGQETGFPSVSRIDTAVGSDRCQYRETVAQADSPGISDRVAEASEELADFEGEVVAEVAEQLGVTEDAVRTAMETLGLTAYDLMEPQNLVQLAIVLTKAQDAADLLVDPQFMELMDSVGEKSQALMEQMDVPMDQKGELIASLDAMAEQAGGKTETAAVPELAEAQDVPIDQTAVPVAETVSEAPIEAEAQTSPMSGQEVPPQDQTPVQVVQTEEETAEANQNPAQVTQGEEQTPVQAVQGEEQTPVQAVQGEANREQTPLEELEEQPEEPAETAKTLTEEPKNQAKGDGEPKGELPDRSERQQSQTAIGKPENGAAASVQTLSQTPIAEPKIQTVESAYLSIDAMELIEQIAEQVKVSISEGSTSMEMQLNPENLGKIYLQVTAKEGTVNAQLLATSEAVRAALEAQMAELKESLNQAGVKVDAIEVTVASHEFEQNLEQDMGREKREGERAEAQSQRRSIRLDDLDSLAGVMSEEEALVARIMRDNGNSMDLTA